MKRPTELIHTPVFSGTVGGKAVRTINPPVYRGSTVLFETFEDLAAANRGEYKGIAYGTAGLPTQRLFEEEVRKLEGGALCRSFPSGINAIIMTLLAFTRAGDHILVCDNVYGPTRHFCEQVLRRFDVATDFLPATVGQDVAQYIRPRTRLIFLESPGSNTFEIQDIPAATRIARQKEIITVLDNTWATPLFLNPFALGIDISIQSVTKYLSGHSDLLLGTVTVTEKHAEAFQKFYRTMEAFTDQNDCYLALRGIKTLPVRLRQHEQAAIHIATWLEKQEPVDKVLHPALPSHPEHMIWKRDFSGSTGLFGFTFRADYSVDQIASFVNALQLFGIGYSWGGFKSLVTAGKYDRSIESRYDGRWIIRLHIGLEDPEDLRADLENGLTTLASR